MRCLTGRPRSQCEVSSRSRTSDPGRCQSRPSHFSHDSALFPSPLPSEKLSPPSRAPNIILRCSGGLVKYNIAGKFVGSPPTPPPAGNSHCNGYPFGQLKQSASRSRRSRSWVSISDLLSVHARYRNLRLYRPRRASAPLPPWWKHRGKSVTAMPWQCDPSFLITVHRRRLLLPGLHWEPHRDAFQAALPDPADLMEVSASSLPLTAAAAAVSPSL